ncbi:MAG: type II secretion system F family protein [Muribaculaceae bacterium]|nr:type II secretion system F family protein [Roseburia sp.]MCM1430245.1 type II secretion system F family protein [Muribaculaceae bacterium]MCM1493673.1 type II secretion system F family protein [Muribaculaceae bacterium]
MKHRKKHLSEAELSAFCEQISMVIKAGLPIYYGISILRDEAADEETAALLTELYTPMEVGGTLHAALTNTGVFPDYMIHMIELGETTGRLEESLDSLSAYYTREMELRDGIKNAITYPLIMTCMMVVVILVMLAKVLPVFSQIYAQLGSELTGMAKTLMNISNVLNRYTVVFVIIFILVLAAAGIFYRLNAGRGQLFGKKLSASIAAGRVANCLYLALASGLDTDQGLDLAESLVDNSHMQLRIQNCREHIRHGESFDRSLLLSGIFSQMYASWITIGYKTGDMDAVMRRISLAYEEDTDEQLSHLISVLEPALVVILCVFIGLILISFLLPLLGIITSIG